MLFQGCFGCSESPGFPCESQGQPVSFRKKPRETLRGVRWAAGQSGDRAESAPLSPGPEVLVQGPLMSFSEVMGFQSMWFVLLLLNLSLRILFF